MSKVILITGTRKGLGRSLAERYLELGDTVVGCSRKESNLDHPNYRHYILDVAEEMDVVKMVRSIKREYGHIDILLNNAGIAAMNHTLSTPYSTVEKVFRTNFFGTFLMVREVSKVMMKSKAGRIVNYTTVAVPMRLAGESVYAASKAAVESFTQVTAHELAEFGITVNALGPTPVRTDLIKNVPEEKLDQLIQRQAIKRFGNFEDVFNVIEFYTSPKSGFITGQILYLGGRLVFRVIILLIIIYVTQ